MSAFRWTLLVGPLCIAACAGGPTAEELGVRPSERMILLRTDVKATSEPGPNRADVRAMVPPWGVSSAVG